MKITYFNNLNHQYNRVIFEFTDEEKQAAGFNKTSKEPAILEILRLLNRIYDNGSDENMLRKFIDKKSLGIPFNKINLTNVSGLTDSITTVKKLGSVRDLVENKKYRDHVNLLDELQRKKDAWKGKALRLIGFLNNKDEVIKRLLRENKHYRNTMTEGGL